MNESRRTRWSGGSGSATSGGSSGAAARSGDLLERGEERELAFLRLGLGLGRHGQRSRPVAVEAHEEPRVAAHELDRRVAGLRRAPRPRRAGRAPSAIGVGVSRSEPRSTEPETISRSFARVIAT